MASRPVLTRDDVERGYNNRAAVPEHPYWLDQFATQSREAVLSLSPELAAHCGLSVPAVITGCDYRLHVQAPEFRLHHVYAFDGTRFEVTILCDGLK